jgi:cytochrome oxidase Cu insertion factor (SCO1/SenC/PrrC family)
MTEIKKKPLMAISIFVISLLPILLAAIIYVTGWGIPQGRLNNGVLIDPPLDIKQLSLNEIKKNEKRNQPNMNTWWLLTFDNGSCDEACQKRVWQIRQINTALGKNQERVQHGLIVTGVLTQAIQPFLKDYPGLTIFETPMQQLDSWSQKIMMGKLLSEHYIVIADPLGNVMLYYTPDKDPRDILEDLNKLLKYSTIG